MKNKLKIILPAGLIALALICVIVVRQGDPGQEDPGAQQTVPAEETPDMTAGPEEIYTLPPIPSGVPVYTKAPAVDPDGTPAGETVTTEPDGTIVITPDFEAQESQAVKIVTPDSQVKTNMSGGEGGDLQLGDDGAYHGDNKPTPPLATPVPAPTTAPVPPTPAPVETSVPEVEPAPTPEQGPQGGPPSYDGKKDGQMSPDGQYMWIGGLGWIDQSSTDGGTGGQIPDDFDGHIPGSGLSGNKVGEM